MEGRRGVTEERQGNKEDERGLEGWGGMGSCWGELRKRGGSTVETMMEVVNV